jgi:hypothetical protein
MKYLKAFLVYWKDDEVQCAFAKVLTIVVFLCLVWGRILGQEPRLMDLVWLFMLGWTALVYQAKSHRVTLNLNNKVRFFLKCPECGRNEEMSVVSDKPEVQ